MSLQKGLESKDQTLHEIDKLMQRWEQRITLRNLSLVDRFINREVYILLHLITKNAGELWVARIDVEMPKSKELGYPVRDKKGVASNSKEHPVLVDIVKLMEQPQGMVSTLVRFERVDSFYRFRTHSLYFSSLVPFISGKILCNREFDLSTSNFPGSNDDKLICQVVEGCPEIMDLHLQPQRWH